MTEVADPVKFARAMSEQADRFAKGMGITREQFDDPEFWRRLREVNCRAIRERTSQASGRGQEDGSTTP